MPPEYDLKELGSTGLKQYGGYVQEEFLRELQGLRWARVIRQMVDNDATIGAILYAIDMMLRQVSWEIQPASQSNEDMELADFVKGALFEDMSHSWPDTLSEILSYLPWGWSYLETVYKVRSGDTADPAKRSKFSDNKIGWRKWSIRAQETLSRWQFDPDGGIQGMWQRDSNSLNTGGEVLIPIEKALHFKTTNRKNNPEAKSIIRNAYVSWYYKTKIGSIEAIGIERDLAGLPTAWVPPAYLSADAGSDYSAILTQIKTIVTNVRRDEQEGVVFPLQYDENGNKLFDFTLMSTGGTRQFDVDKVINRYDQRIAASVLADFVLLGSQSVGSFALSKEKTDMFATALTGFATQISEVINRHAIPRLMVLNGFKADRWPTLQPGKIESVDLSVLGEYVTKLSTAGFPLFPSADGKLEAHLLKVGGLPSQEPEAFVEQAEEAKAEMEAANAALMEARSNLPADEPEE